MGKRIRVLRVLMKSLPLVMESYDVRPLKSAYQARLNQTPVSNGKWSRERGESTFVSDKSE